MCIRDRAAEAATVLKKTESPEHPEKIKAAGGENLQDALLKVGISAKEALTAFESIYRLRRQEKSVSYTHLDVYKRQISCRQT